MEEYLVRVLAGARSKPKATTFGQLRLQVHTSVSACTAITKMPPYRVLYVDTSPEDFLWFIVLLPMKEVVYTAVSVGGKVMEAPSNSCSV